MKLLKFLVISFLIFGFVKKQAMSQSPCKEIKVTAEAKDASPRGNDGSISVKIDGESRNFRIYLIAHKKENNRLDLPVEEIKNLSPGNYELVITESKEGEFCPKHLKVAIK